MLFESECVGEMVISKERVLFLGHGGFCVYDVDESESWAASQEEIFRNQ